MGVTHPPTLFNGNTWCLKYLKGNEMCSLKVIRTAVAYRRGGISLDYTVCGWSPPSYDKQRSWGSVDLSGLAVYALVIPGPIHVPS